MNHASDASVEGGLGNVANPLQVDPADPAIRVAGDGDQGNEVVHGAGTSEGHVETRAVEDITMNKFDIEPVEGRATVQVNRPHLPISSQQLSDDGAAEKTGGAGYHGNHGWVVGGVVVGGVMVVGVMMVVVVVVVGQVAS
jgi:hypothetical protein